ncbi:MAG: polysaccharide biosynthesis protein, partial [Armatimonadetes bacterium]|nr:polysaccharide biosynthesis protein [Armatimonadota bacterium]
MSVRLFTGSWLAREFWGGDALAAAIHSFQTKASAATRVRVKDASKFLIDIVLIAGAGAWAWFTAFGQVSEPVSPVPFLAVVICARLPIYFGFKLYRQPWRKVSRYDVLWLTGSALLGAPVIALLLYLLPDPFTVRGLMRPYLMLATEPALHLILLGGARIGARSIAVSQRHSGQGHRTLVVGTGDAARSLVWQIQESTTAYNIVGLVDDDMSKQDRRVLGLPVLGTTEDIAAIVDAMRIERIVVAIPSLSPERMREILLLCERTGALVRILPPLRELMEIGVGVGALREVRMEDLLPRSEVTLDHDAIAEYLHGRTVLVTGGGGSIGRELCRQVLQVGARRLLVLGRGENSVYEALQELHELDGDCDIVPIICDVQDRQGLRHVFDLYRPDVVFHAAAHKHVPLMEHHPWEAVRNNVVGTLNVVRLAVESGVSRFVLVSTDKAVEPSSVMGSTKRVAEMIVKGYAVATGANMVSVRFGNVLGSRGSVIPLMTRQIRNGHAITVTDPKMVRYFMTIPEAAQLILQAGAVGGRGEVFVLDMGYPVRIMDLAQDLIRLSGLVPNQDIPIEVTGRRPGEKLSEDFLSKMESAGAKKNGHFYIAPPEPVVLDHLLEHVRELRSA